jgi:hypothetical protein
MRYSAQLAKYGRFTGGPTDIHGSVDIGMCLVITGTTPKLVLGLAILFGTVPAGGASSASITRVDSNQYDSSQCGLVRQEQAQLRECPGMQNGTLLLPGLDPIAASLEVFNGYSALGAFSFGNDLFGNTVIHMCGEPTLAPRKLFQFAFGSSSLLLLEFASQQAVAIANGLNLAPTISLPIRGRGNISHTQIDPQELGRLNWYRGGRIDRAVKVKLPLTKDQISLPFNTIEAFFLVLTVNQGNNNPTFWQCPETDTVYPLEPHNACIVANRAVRLEDWADFLIAREAFDRFANRPYRHLGRQAKAGTNFRICQFVDRRLAEYSCIEPTPGRKSCGFVYALHRSQQSDTLLGVRQKLQLEDKFHYLGVYRLKGGIFQSSIL